MVKYGGRKTHPSILTVGLEAFGVGRGCQYFGEGPVVTVLQLCSFKVIVSQLMLHHKPAPLSATVFRDLY